MIGSPTSDAQTLVEESDACGGADVSVEPLPTGGTIGRFVVLEELGRGGMGVVVRAYDPKLQREVALKAIKPSRVTRTNHARMVREARSMAKLSHPNVVPVHDVEIGIESNASIYLVMEYVPGGTLRDRMNRELPWRTLVELLVAAGRGLQAAHDAGILHRDFKPENVLVGDDGRVRVTDFGLARAHRQPRSSVEPDRSEDGVVSNEDFDHLETQAGHVLGTPAYMSPEQHASDELTAAADQFAYCVVLWEAIVGTRPFRGKVRRLKSDKGAGPPPWPSGRDVPGRIVDAIKRGLDPEPARRWASMNELLDELEGGLVPPQTSTMLGGAVLGLVAIGAVGVVWATQRDDVCSGAAEQLGTAWDAQRREQVEAAFLDSGVRYAEGVWQRLYPRVDAYAVEWTTSYEDACEATHVRKEQSEAMMDARVHCLLEARRDLDAATSLLATADRTVVERAYDVVGGLPSLDRCADLVALSSSVPPPDRDEEPVVAQLRDELARARARSKAGKYQEAIESFVGLLDRAKRLRYEPVRTDIQLSLGYAHDGQGDYPAAEQSLEDAVKNAIRWEQWEQAQEAASLLVVVTGLRQRKFDAAFAHASTAEAFLNKLGNPEPIEAAFHDNLSALYYSQGDYERARQEAQRSVDLFLNSRGPDASSTIQAINDLAATLHHLGRSEEAVRMFRQVVEFRQREFGLHPWVGLARNNLGGALSALSRHDEAQRELKAAVEILEQTLGPEHPMVASTYNTWGSDFQTQKNFVEAKERYERAIEIFDIATGPEHPSALMSRSNLGGALVALEDYESAIAVLTPTLRLQEEGQGAEHPETLHSRHMLAQAMFELGRDAEAKPLLERQWRAKQKISRKGDRRWGNVAWWLAKVERRTGGDPAKVRELAAEAAAYYDEAEVSQEADRVRQWIAELEQPASGP